jgi:GTP-binding protein
MQVDRPTARTKVVVNEVFDMFCDLSCPDEFLDYPLYYASGKNGWAVENMDHEKRDVDCILNGIIKHIPRPKVPADKTFSMLVTQTQPNNFYGKMVLGKINSGEI